MQAIRRGVDIVLHLGGSATAIFPKKVSLSLFLSSLYFFRAFLSSLTFLSLFDSFEPYVEQVYSGTSLIRNNRPP